MTKHFFLMIIGAFLALTGLVAQEQNDPILFTVADNPVRLSEFKYIYSKTNGKAADYSKASLQEYLDLYIKFKLKVKKAKDMRLDTITALREELAGYRRQLADSYLMNKKVNERLVQELYERSKEDLDLWHILVLCPPDAVGNDTLGAYKKILRIKERLQSGQDFSMVAREESEDRSAPDNGGHIGYVTALFPDGLYNLESVAYSLSVGEVSKPVRTKLGYHVARVMDRRPARGEVEVAHILIRNEERRPQMPKMIIDSLYARLSNGESFEKLAETRSEDTRSAEKGGYIGFITINRYEQEFEDAAFSLAKDGDFSEPFSTSVGWHIIKRISKKEIQPFEQARAQLEARIKRDARYEIARTEMVEEIKRTNGFKEYPQVATNFAKTLNDTFFTFRWRVPEPRPQELLLTLGNERYTLGDFADFLNRASRQRLRMANETPIPEAIAELYQEFVNETVMRFEERQLDRKYPEFKALLREYEEGILLFEATRINVWDKASQDTVGLNNFFKTIKGKYRWDERAVVTTYFVDGLNKELIEPMRAFASGNQAQAVMAKFNTADTIGLRFKEEILEKGKSAEALEFTDWKVGALTTTKLDRKNNEYSFRKIERVIAPEDKALNDARGYIIADYQDYLEGQWVNALRKQYSVKVEKGVLDSLVKK